MKKVGIVGAGLIGRAWAIVFARAGWDVALYDSVVGQRDTALSLIAISLAEMAEQGFAADAASNQLQSIDVQTLPRSTRASPPRP